jgi:hypothetical protein
MGKARGESSRYYIVYSDPLNPLDFHGWPVERAFDVLLEQCGYAASWDVKQTATLNFLHLDGPYKNIPVGILASVDHPKMFSAEIKRGGHGEEMARENIMREVLRTGMNGWRGETRDRFTIIHGIAEHRKRNSERFESKGD